MSLRLRLVASLGAVLTVALVIAGVLLVGLVRVGLVDRIDSELVSISKSPAPMQRLLTVDATDSPGGRSLAVIRYNRGGSITLSLPSGFTDNPDPLPAMPNYTGGVPASEIGRVMELPSVDGSMHYRVLLVNARLGAVIALAAPMSAVDATIATLVRLLLLIGIAAIAVLVAVAWLIVRRGLLPVERVADAAGRIAGGDLSHRTGVPHDGTEVGRLGAAFDGMVDQVQGAFAQQHDALAAKQESEARLRRFVADASHELRTPVTAIRGYAELYRAGGLADPAALEAAMGRIEGESRRMGSLVDDLLLLARLDQGRPLRRDVVDLSRACADAVADLRAAAPTHPVVAAVDAGVRVIGDDDRLRQVVGNLLANVGLHTPAETPAEVVLRAASTADGGRWAELRVVDHGPGIPPEHAARVFDRFYRADAGRSRETGGSGLGLSIVASIVAAHNGRLWHEATPGGGATFCALLPLADGAGAGAALTGNSQPSPGQS
ncbi:MAG: sensor histidine kinase [Candidatus Limnocylindrales bacterium]